MTYPFQIIRVNTKTKNGLELFHESKHIINGEILEKTKLKVIEIKNSALIVQRLNENEQPFQLYSIYEQYWKKENQIFELAEPDLYTETKTLDEIKNSSSYKELTERPINQQWPFGYWGLTDTK